MVGAGAANAQAARAVAGDFCDRGARATTGVDVVIAIAPRRHSDVIRPYALQHCLTVLFLRRPRTNDVAICLS